MDKQKIIDKILKVKALADKGTEGERANAERMLKELMEKYGISESDLKDDVKDVYMLDTKNSMFIQLLVQIIHTNVDPDIKIWNIESISKKDKKALSEAGYGDATGNVAIGCTKMQFIEIKMLCDIYREDFEKQLDVFMYAYFSKNKLLLPPKEGDESQKPSDQEIEKALKAYAMERGIDKKEIYKMIENT